MSYRVAARIARAKIAKLYSDPSARDWAYTRVMGVSELPDDSVDDSVIEVIMHNLIASEVLDQ